MSWLSSSSIFSWLSFFINLSSLSSSPIIEKQLAFDVPSRFARQGPPQGRGRARCVRNGRAGARASRAHGAMHAGNSACLLLPRHTFNKGTIAFLCLYIVVGGIRPSSRCSFYYLVHFCPIAKTCDEDNIPQTDWEQSQTSKQLA